MTSQLIEGALAGQRIAITGASSGIGRATALLANAQGAQVALISRDRARLDAVAAQLSGTGHVTLPCDVTDAEQVASVLTDATDAIGPLNTLVHAAGTHALTPLRVMSSVVVSRTFDVNVTSALMLARAFRRPAVRAEQASIVLLSSAIGLVGGSGVAAYAASKAAVASIAQSLALELSGEQIRVNAVAAGIVSTPLTEGFKKQIGDEAWQRIVEAHPMGIGTADDVAAAVLFLASPAARWITGSVLPVDGGYTAR